MAFGRPAIDPVKNLDVRAIGTAVSNARQRIEFLEAAVTVLQGLPTSSSAQIAQLQAQISALIAGSATFGQKPANTVYAGPASGAQAVPAFRALVLADMPLASLITAIKPVDWADVPGDYTLGAADAGNALATTGMSGAQTITVPGEDVSIDIGATVMIAQEGEADVDVLPVSGVLVRSLAGAVTLAGPGAVAWLTKRDYDSWFLYGDLV